MSPCKSPIATSLAAAGRKVVSGSICMYVVQNIGPQALQAHKRADGEMHGDVLTGDDWLMGCSAVEVFVGRVARQE